MSDIDTMVNAICEDRGYDSPKEFDYSDVEYLAQDLGMSEVAVCAILRIEVLENCSPFATVNS
jgi:hypothetical protein